MGTINETVSRHSPYRLERMQALLQALGDPHLAYPTLHVGGTSGKGSTSTMLAAVLSASGKRVGLHTKPHLTSMTERMRIDGTPISEERFGELLQEMRPTLESVAGEFGRPTYYETLLALSFVYFAHEQVDCAVIEVGLGGRLDGTNLVRPEVSIITNIGFDHTDVLGPTLVDIATDKAGIAKPGVPLISDVTDPAARAVIERQCRETGAPFISVQDVARIEQRPGDRYGQSFAVITAAATYELALPVLGGFQQRNAATAIVALEVLRPALRPSVADIERAMATLVIPGRMEFFPSHPSVVFDIAHNRDKARALADGLRATFPGRRIHFVLAIGESKDALAILEAFHELPATFVLTTFETAGRSSTKPQRLANMLESLGTWGRAVADPVEAFGIARRNAAADDIVVVTGSTFIVGTLRDWWFANVAANAR
jgi:dihydrofolate synthase/folylpolyglutamate synthase